MSHGSQREGNDTNTGRHRHRGAETWTPTVPGQTRAGHHTPDDGSALPEHGHISGELPIPAQGSRGPHPAPTRPAPSGPGSSGPGSTGPASADSASEQPPQRTRVTFTHPEMPAPEPAEGTTQAHEKPTEHQEEDEEPENGLAVFNLGSVPASVTPPRTWRKAAWFAAGSSGGVMGLLFAGSFLLAQSPPDPQASEQWSYLNYQENAPLLLRDDLLQRSHDPRPPESTPHSESATASSSSSASSSTRPSPSGRDAPASSPGTAPSPPGNSAEPTAPTPERPNGTSGAGPVHPTGTPTTEPTSSPPEKPPPTPAPSSVVHERVALYSVRAPQEMSKHSQKFLNAVTENPAEARQLTAGQLHDKGTAGLRHKYADVAYFVVKSVLVYQGKGVTVNTVKTVYDDGHSEIEKVRLTFDNNGDIVKATR